MPLGFFGVLGAGHLVDYGLAGGGGAACYEDGADAHPEGDDGHGDENGALAGGEVGESAVFFDRDIAVENFLVGPEEIAGGENDAGGGPGGPVPVDLVGAEQDQKFADEAVEHGQAERRERDKEEERGEARHGSSEAAELGHFKGVTAIVEHADEQEEAAGGNAVGEHLEDGALHGNLVEGEDAENDEAEVADAGVGDEFFEIGLNESYERAVNDTDDGEHRDWRRELLRRDGEERQAEAHHAVGAHFQEDASEHDGAGGGGFDVGVGQPGVEREERNFNGESHEEGEEEKRLRAAGEKKSTGLERLLNRGRDRSCRWRCKARGCRPA